MAGDEVVKKRRIPVTFDTFYATAGLTPQQLNRGELKNAFEKTPIGQTQRFLPTGLVSNAKAKFSYLQLNDEIKSKFVKTWGDKLRTLPKTGFKFGLHATTAKYWDIIRTKGLVASAQGACGPGIYQTATAGICKNAENQDEFTTFRYGTGDFSGDHSEPCRFVISMIMNKDDETREDWGVPSKSTDGTELPGWLLSQEEDTIPLLMVEMDRKAFAELLINEYDPKRESNTRLRREYFPTAAEIESRKRMERMAQLAGSSSKPSSQWSASSESD